MAWGFWSSKARSKRTKTAPSTITHSQSSEILRDGNRQPEKSNIQLLQIPLQKNLNQLHSQNVGVDPLNHVLTNESQQHFDKTIQGPENYNMALKQRQQQTQSQHFDDSFGLSSITNNDLEPLLQGSNNLTGNSQDYSTGQTHTHYQNVTETTNVSRRGSLSLSLSEQKEISEAFGENSEGRHELKSLTKHYENLPTQINLSLDLTRTKTKDEKENSYETIFSTDNSASALIPDQRNNQNLEEIVEQKGKKLYKINGHIFQPMRFHWNQSCKFCHDRIWGLGKQGFKCIQCKLFVHKKCHKLVQRPCDQENEDSTDNLKKNYSLDDFHLISVIGRRSYAKEIMVELKETSRIYTMKVIRKALITEGVDWKIEKRVFEMALSRPFLVALHSCFQTPTRLFFVSEFVPGGNLLLHMQRHRRLPEEHACFYTAEISLALSYLHQMGIIFNNLKLDNVLLDHEGHIKLTDYGMCKEVIDPHMTTSKLCGTPDYENITPEIARGDEYGFSVDWYALGVMLYEMICGRSPFDITEDEEKSEELNLSQPLEERSHLEIILEKSIRITRLLSDNALSAVKGFLSKVPDERLEYKHELGYLNIVNHPFFETIDWQKLEQKQIVPPYKPHLENNRDLSNFHPVFTEEPVCFTPADIGFIDKIDQSEFFGFEHVNLSLDTENCVSENCNCHCQTNTKIQTEADTKLIHDFTAQNYESLIQDIIEENKQAHKVHPFMSEVYDFHRCQGLELFADVP